MRGILSFCLLLFQLSILAQQGDSIQDSIIISHNRQLLLEQFKAGRLDSVSMLADSLDEQKITLLWPAERMLLCYWTERYRALDWLIWNFDEACSEAEKNHPPDQTVWNVLSFYSLESIDTLVSWIDQTGCDDWEFNTRVRVLEHILRGDWAGQTDVNLGISSFIHQYYFGDKDKQLKMIHVDPKPVEPDPNADPWDVSFGMGLGPTSLSGNIGSYLSTKSCLTFDLSVYYKRWRFSLLMQPIFANLKRDIPVNDGNSVWEAGTSANIGNYGLALGYSIIDSKVLKMNPFIGLTVSESSPSEQEIDYNVALSDASIRWGFAGIYGWDIDIKLYNLISILKRNDMLVSFNTRLNYIPSMFNNVNPRYSGNLLFVTFGFSINVSSW